MKIYKFRPLTEELDFWRLKNILETGYFWCSNFWDLNDPMEGIFFFYENSIEKIFNEKKKYKICAFSGMKGFENPVMWGYYAAGFRGVAVEIEVNVNSSECGEQGGVKEIERDDKLPETDNVEKILLNKSTKWAHEDECRFLIKSDDKSHKIGKITAVYFGAPYGDLVNSQPIQDNSESIKKYAYLKEEIIKVAGGMNIFCSDVKIVEGIVTKVNKNLCNQE